MIIICRAYCSLKEVSHKSTDALLSNEKFTYANNCNLGVSISGAMLKINFKTLLEPGCSTQGAFALLLYLYKLASAFAIVLCWGACTFRKRFYLFYVVRFIIIRLTSGWPVGPGPHHLLRLKNQRTQISEGWKFQGKKPEQRISKWIDEYWNLWYICMYRSCVAGTERSDNPIHFQQRWQ